MLIVCEILKTFTTAVLAIRALAAQSWLTSPRGRHVPGGPDERTSPRGRWVCQGKHERPPGRDPCQAGGTPGARVGCQPALAVGAADLHRRGRDPAARLGAGGVHPGPA